MFFSPLVCCCCVLVVFWAFFFFCLLFEIVNTFPWDYLSVMFVEHLAEKDLAGG